MVKLPPEAAQWTDQEISLFRSSNGFVVPRSKDGGASAGATDGKDKASKPLTPRQKAALRAKSTSALPVSPGEAGGGGGGDRDRSSVGSIGDWVGTDDEKSPTTKPAATDARSARTVRPSTTVGRSSRRAG